MAFGLFLELRDLGLFLLLAEREPQEKYRAERHEGQQEFEEAFHLNLPRYFYNKRREDVNLLFNGGLDILK